MAAITVTSSRHIAAPPDAVWDILGDFGNEARWISLLRDSYLIGGGPPRVGAIRHCDLAKPALGRRSVREELIEYQPGHRLTYRVPGGIGIFRSAKNTWRIRAEGDGTRVETEGRFETRRGLGWLAPLGHRTLQRYVDLGTREFKEYVERRQVVAA